MTPLRCLPFAALLALGCTRPITERDLLKPRRAAWTTDRIQRRNLEIPLPEGGALRGWHLVHPESRGTVIFFYGNGETVQYAATRLWRLAEAFRLDVLCVDYRGYGFSDGTPALRALREDALRVFDATTGLRTGKPTLVAGFSIGTLPAVHLAASRSVDGLLLLAPVSTFEAVLPSWQRQVPWYARPFVRLRPDPALPIHPAPLDEVGGVKAPLLVVHGEADRVIPVACGRSLHLAAGSAVKALVTRPGLDHNDLNLLTDDLRPEVDRWLQPLFAAPVSRSEP